MARTMTSISFSYPKEMKSQLLELAQAERRPLSNYIQMILEEHLKSKAKPNNKPKRKVARKRK